MKKLMAANWKMYKIRREAADMLNALTAALPEIPADREVVIFAPFTILATCSDILQAAKGFSLGAQNMYPADQGAFTGEISPRMLKDCGCAWVLTGHSERRAIFKESSSFVGEKTVFALEQGLRVVLCIGETLEEREAGRLEAVLASQLEQGLAAVADNCSPDDLAIAYEPVWAIGTGKVAGPAEILESHALVRTWLQKRFPKQGSHLRVLYGGSVKPENSDEIMTLDNVDGLLVGGASLDAEIFRRVVLA